MHHKVEIKLDSRGNKDYVVAVPKEILASDGDSLEIYSNEGTFWVKFDPWVFRPEIWSNGVLIFEKNKDGGQRRFKFECYLIPYGQTKTVSYDSAAGGGNGNVEP
jgi:hypothetical protein